MFYSILETHGFSKRAARGALRIDIMLDKFPWL